jgi:hypothetical protein
MNLYLDLTGVQHREAINQISGGIPEKLYETFARML